MKKIESKIRTNKTLIDMLAQIKREIDKICKKINPDLDNESFDYECSCYKSALKAYKSLVKDNHSDTSWEFTTSILKRMLDGLPLIPITDEDFNVPTNSKCYEESDGTVVIQCPRMSSLFKYERKDGSIAYHDVDRQYCCNIEFPDDTFQCQEENIVDELFPITMPYYPTGKKFKIGIREFLCNPENGDYDHRAIEYVITPDSTKIVIGKYYREENRKMVEITKEQFELDEKQRIDTIEKEVASRLLFELEDKITILTQSQKDEIARDLENLCLVFRDVNPNYRRYSFLYSLIKNDVNSDERQKFGKLIDYIQWLDMPY